MWVALARDMLTKIPEDQVELPVTTMQKKPVREIPERGVQRSIEVQMQLSEFIGQLMVLFADVKAFLDDQKAEKITEIDEIRAIDEALAARTQALIEQLRVFYRQVKVPIHEEWSYRKYSEMLKEL